MCVLILLLELLSFKNNAGSGLFHFFCVRNKNCKNVFLDSECINPPSQNTKYEPEDDQNEDIQLCVKLEDKLFSEFKYPTSTESTRTSGLLLHLSYLHIIIILSAVLSILFHIDIIAETYL